MKLVAESFGLGVVDLHRLLQHKDTLLGSLNASTVGTPTSGPASKKKPTFRTKTVLLNRSPATPSKPSAP